MATEAQKDLERRAARAALSNAGLSCVLEDCEAPDFVARDARLGIEVTEATDQAAAQKDAKVRKLERELRAELADRRLLRLVFASMSTAPDSGLAMRAAEFIERLPLGRHEFEHGFPVGGDRIVEPMDSFDTFIVEPHDTAFVGIAVKSFLASDRVADAVAAKSKKLRGYRETTARVCGARVGDVQVWLVIVARQRHGGALGHFELLPVPSGFDRVVLYDAARKQIHSL